MQNEESSKPAISTAIVTGATGGIGTAIATTLARNRHHIILACRNTTKGEALKRQIIALTGNTSIDVMELDLGSQTSIRSFVLALQNAACTPRILVNNAGTMCRDFSLTADGYETTLGVNYLGTVLLTRLVLPLMPSKGDCAITTTISVTCNVATLSRNLFLPDPAHYTRLGAYSRSKLALYIFTAQLADQLAGSNIRVNAVDPGIVNTEMIRMQRWFDPLADILFRPFIKSPQRGAQASLHALEQHLTGMVYRSRGRQPIDTKIVSHPIQRWLSEQTDEILNLAATSSYR